MLCLQTIQCTVAGCSCECFAPGKNKLRMCDTCEHGWVVHGKLSVFLFTVNNFSSLASYKMHKYNLMHGLTPQSFFRLLLVLLRFSDFLVVFSFSHYLCSLWHSAVD